MSKQHRERREYRVTTRDKDLKIIHSVAYRDPKPALQQFRRSLEGAGRTRDQANKELLGWVLVLMQGGGGLSVPNPDPNTGTVDITILAFDSDLKVVE